MNDKWSNEEEIERRLDEHIQKAHEQMKQKDPKTDDKAERDKTTDTQAQQLTKISTAAGLFHAPNGTGYADISINGHRETWAIRSQGFRRWLMREFYKRDGNVPNANAMQAALGLIEAMAHFDGPEREVRVRVAGQDGKIYLDLADGGWSAIEIDASGWRLVEEPPVRFRRAAGMLALPIPVRGGKIESLRPFLNVKGDDDFVLAVAWLLAALNSHGPYPVLALLGVQGAAKSTFTTILRSLVDPNTAPLRALPREDRDLFIAANNSLVLAFDNVSGLPSWISDTLCRLATGGGFAVRQLYTDQDEVLFDSRRPILLNGIEDYITRPDLADRSIFLALQEIPERQRKEEQKLFADLERARPKILGALLDAVAQGLRRLPGVRLERLPRMADFAKWATACEGALWKAETFAKAYDANRAEAVETVIESDPVATALRSFMAERTEWAGTASDLLGALSLLVSEPERRGKAWPTAPNKLSGRLRRQATFLRQIGIKIDARREGKLRTKMLRITRKEEGGEQPSASSASSANGNSSLNVNDLAADDTADDRPGADDSIVRPTVRPNPLKNKAADDRTVADDKIPPYPPPADDPLSIPPFLRRAYEEEHRERGEAPRCAQCNGRPDGTERPVTVNGQALWLHEECEKFYRPEGWSFRQGSRLAFLHSSL
jgi:hypothetical protein